MAGRRGRGFTNWLKRMSEEQVPEEFCSTLSLRGPHDPVTLPSSKSLGSALFSQRMSAKRVRIT